MNGLVLLNKPADITSFGAAAALRRIYGEKRIGHTGTLDPMATGVLPVLLGRATRLSPFLLMADKAYRATIRLGLTTDTLDITGQVLSQKPVEVDDSQLQAALQGFLGPQMQVPPMYSALKKEGKKLYELARQGVEVDREARPIEIKKIELAFRQGDDFCIDVACSKGTYIRSLCDDIGRVLGCGATLAALERRATGGFLLQDCVTLEQVKANPQAALLTADRAVMHLPAAQITQNQRVRFLNGGGLYLNRLQMEPQPNGTMVRVYCGEEFLGLAHVDVEQNLLLVNCVISEG